MRDDLDRRLDGLLGRIVELGERTDAMLDDAIAALRDGDEARADQVVLADAEVDRLDREVQHQVVQALALHAPVARDLRLLMATIRATLHLERMGDYAVNVARAAKQSTTFPADPELAAQLREMGGLAREVGREAVRAFVHADERLARSIPLMDDKVDQLNIGIFQRLVRLAAADEQRLEWATRMILVVRLLERYGDHGVGLAKQALFVATGETFELSSNEPD